MKVSICDLMKRQAECRQWFKIIYVTSLNNCLKTGKLIKKLYNYNELQWVAKLQTDFLSDKVAHSCYRGQKQQNYNKQMVVETYKIPVLFFFFFLHDISHSDPEHFTCYVSYISTHSTACTPTISVDVLRL
jgi:hypothetical protein